MGVQFTMIEIIHNVIIKVFTSFKFYLFFIFLFAFGLEADDDSDTEAPSIMQFKKSGSESSAPDSKVLKVFAFALMNNLHSIL